MKKLDPVKYLKNFLFLSSTIFILKYNVFAQTYHDCTSTQDFNNFLEENSNSEEMIGLMELEFAKSLSKFDKCVDNDYLDIKNREDRNESENSEKRNKTVEESAQQKDEDSEGSKEKLAEQKQEEGERSEESAQQKDQDSEGSKEKLAEQKQQEGDKSEEELAEQKKEDINESKERLKKANNDYNDFSSKNNSEEFLNNKNTGNDKIVNSVASSEISGTEANRDDIEEVSAFENNISKDTAEYENDQTEENNGIIPEDIPQDDNDSVLEQQIKLAAKNEKDPEKKKRLWNEYRKYKGLPQKE